MVCPICGRHFRVFEVKSKLKFLHGVDYNDLPERLCYCCSMDYVKANSVPYDDDDYFDPSDPETY